MRSLLLILCLFPLLTHAQNFNRPVPAGMPEYEFKRFDTTDVGHYFLAPYSADINSPYNQGSMILDPDGYIAWFYVETVRFLFDFEWHSEHNLFTFMAFNDQNDYQYFVLDENLELVHDIVSIPNFPVDVHEFEILDNGNYMVLGSRDSVMDLSAYTFDNGIQGSSTTVVKGFTLAEFDQQNNMVWYWYSNEYLHPTECIDSVYGYNPNKFDYAHANAIEEDFDGNYLVSLRHMDCILKINKTTGAVMWRHGGKLSDFTSTNDQHGHSGQHDIRRLANGRIAMFDNMNSKNPPPIRSRVVEFSLDTVNMTSTREYKYRYLPGFAALAQGSYQVLDNNYRAIGYGRASVPNPSMVLIDPQDSIVSELYFADEGHSYRVRVSPLTTALPRPEVQCVNNGDGTVTLTAPSTYNYYLWSDGSTSTSTTISTADTVQVWVDHGIGFIGSEPIIIDDPQTFCLIDNVNEQRGEAKPTPIGLYDLLGRSVANPTLGSLYIIRFDNGTGEMVYWDENSRRNYPTLQ